jgi:hypothetical protein
MLACLALAFPAGMFAQILNAPPSAIQDAFQVNYASRLNLGDAVVNVTNAGTSAGANEPIVNSNNYGDICANIYVYVPSQELASCCTCLVSPNSLHAWPVSYGSGNLLQNDVNQAHAGTTAVTLKIVATRPSPYPNGTGCDPTVLPTTTADANALAGGALAGGLTAWATHSHPTNTPTVAITETPFEVKQLSVGESLKLQHDCTNLVTRQSGRFCPGCITGGLVAPAL